jgi:hypothetical protein
MRNRIVESVAAALLVAILATAAKTYVEVQMLRHDVDRLQASLDQLWVDSNDEVQRLHREKRDR